MALSIIQYLDTSGILRSTLVSQELSPEATERLQEYLQNTGIGSMRALPQTATEDLQRSSQVTEDESPNVLNADEAEFLQMLGWSNNDVTSEEADFLREQGLHEPDLVVYEPSSYAAEFLHTSFDTTEEDTTEEDTTEEEILNSSPTHGKGCICRYPWSCKPVPEPLHIFSDGRFGAVGEDRPWIRRGFASSSSPSYLPPASTCTEDRLTLGRPTETGPAFSKGGAFGAAGEGRSLSAFRFPCQRGEASVEAVR